MADKSFYEFKLEADTTTESGSLPFINDQFLDIVNYDEVNPYYYNSWYKENLDHVPDEKAQRARFGLTKMLPYKKISLRYREHPLNENNPGDLIEYNPTGWYEITDSIFVDGVRYLMVVYDDYTKMKIFKQIYVDDLLTCANNNYESPSIGKFVDISNYVYTNSGGTTTQLFYYPFNRCCDAKFTVAARWKGKAKQAGTDWYMKVQQIWDDILYYFYDGWEIINAEAGDYLYINVGALSWQIVPVSLSTTIDWHQWIQTIFARTGVNMQENSDFWLSTPHGWVIYETYGDILHFVCSDWVMHLNFSNMIPAQTEVTSCWAMAANTNNNTNTPGFLISSMINFRPLDTIALYDIDDGDVKFWLSGFLKFYFKASNQFFVSKDYTDIVEFQDYIVMIWPSKTGISYPYTDENSPGIVRNHFREIGWGYLTRWSRVSDGTSFIMADDKWLRALEVNANTYWDSSRFPIVAWWTFQAWPFITDISQFSRELGDKMWMSMEKKQFKMFISNDEWTIVWIKSIEHNYRRQHILADKQITKYREGVYIWSALYDRGGDEKITTYLSFMFGDKTFLTPKAFHSLKLAFGRDSWITKWNTTMQVTYTLSWRTYSVNYDDRDTVGWIKEIMQLKLSGNTDQFYGQYANEIRIESGEWHGKYQPQMLYNTNKIRAFKNYIPTIPVLSGASDTWDFTDLYTISNRSTLHTDLWYMWDTIVFKLFTQGNDILEFYGAQLWYDLTNEVGWSLDNSLVVKPTDNRGNPYVWQK